MADSRFTPFDPETQPILLKLERRLDVLRRIKAEQGLQQTGLNAQFAKVAKKTATLFKDKGESARLDRALRMATEFAFEKLIDNTIKFALTDPPASGRTVSIDLLMMKNGQHVTTTVEAQLGENGWLSCKCPVGADYDVALLLGKSLAWCQLGDIHRLVDETDSNAMLQRVAIGRDAILDGMRLQAENIHELSDNALIYFPASDNHGDRGSVVVLFRPLILRERLRVTHN